MLLTKEVEIYLQMCCKPSMYYSYLFDTKPGELCWSVKQFNWSLAVGLIQTVTLNNSTLRLELWDDMSDDRQPVSSETAFSGISLEQLHIRLHEAAKVETINRLKRFWIDSYKSDLAETFNRIPVEKRELLTFTIESVRDNIKKLERYCTEDISNDFVVQNVELEIKEYLTVLEQHSRG